MSEIVPVEKVKDAKAHLCDGQWMGDMLRGRKTNYTGMEGNAWGINARGEWVRLSYPVPPILYKRCPKS